MKIECIKDKLQNIVAKAEKISGKNLTLPVLKCLLLVAKKNSFSVKSTNLDLGVDFTLPVKTIKEGITAVPAATLNSAISNIPHKNITLELVGNNLRISSPSGTTLIKTLPYEDFPLLPTLSDATTFSLPVPEFLKGLRSVFYSASSSSIKPELGSVYLYSHDGALKFVATDSFRLAEKSVPLRETFPPTLIPIKNVPEIIRVFEDAEGNLEIRETKNQIAFLSPGCFLTSRVVEGTFPDYQQIIPKEATTEAVFLKEDALNALKAATVFSDRSNYVNLSLFPRRKLFEVTAKNSDVGESVQTISSTLSGEDVEMRFNYRYLMDCFSSIPSESISFSFGSPREPLIVRGRNDRSFTYLVMPMNR